ncbi:hypothetical protein RB11271 [Rhodopirellula baltica SH 1]|uniref:Uncharacterized protein n=1 Tax=Rhodopirellula baltica (strain DSM 10527 / NCIMB 13988 / SH1) TaxID=243090 RepID=Q7UEL2_RHOBA|nr:hypothetical protein RB11271 [Rhodopirellula baltica SH 1]
MSSMSCLVLAVEATESCSIYVGRFGRCLAPASSKDRFWIRRTWKSIVRLARPRMGRDRLMSSRLLDGCGACGCECVKAAECIKAELRR